MKQRLGFFQLRFARFTHDTVGFAVGQYFGPDRFEVTISMPVVILVVHVHYPLDGSFGYFFDSGVQCFGNTNTGTAVDDQHAVLADHESRVVVQAAVFVGLRAERADHDVDTWRHLGGSEHEPFRQSCRDAGEETEQGDELYRGVNAVDGFYINYCRDIYINVEYAT